MPADETNELLALHDGRLKECRICHASEFIHDDGFVVFHPQLRVHSIECNTCGQNYYIHADINLDPFKVQPQWRAVEPLVAALFNNPDVNTHDTICSDIVTVDDEFFKYVAAHPQIMQSIHPRKLEELVAELFIDLGYDVELTPYSRDEGKDILIINRTDTGSFLTIVECKRYAASRPVGVDLVERLFGRLSIDRASHAMIATTSSFTAGAKNLQRQFEWLISLRDFDDLKNMIESYVININRQD